MGYKKNAIMNKHDVNVIMPTGRESCLSSAAESSWLCLLS